MLTRTYKTKDDCVSLFIERDFNAMDSTIISDMPYECWCDTWGFITEYDESADDFTPEDDDWYDKDEGLVWTRSFDYGYSSFPAWNTWFVPTEYTRHWCESNLKKVIDCGFVAVMRNGEFFGLAVDGCGYSFRDEHFTPLYDAMGFKWHE